MTEVFEFETTCGRLLALRREDIREIKSQWLSMEGQSPEETYVNGVAVKGSYKEILSTLGLSPIRCGGDAFLKLVESKNKL